MASSQLGYYMSEIRQYSKIEHYIDKKIILGS